MCVAIAMEPGTELSLEEVFKMGRSNADGIGVAWAGGDGQVEWYKSINYTPESATKFIAERKDFFRLVHFRLSTVGGTRVDLCHPFEIGPMANSNQHGHSAKVLIHNGHWHRWTDVVDILKKEEALPDMGPWSDSRLAAYLAHFDPDWLQLITGRVATMDGDGNIELIGDWTALRPGIKVSNKHWDHDFGYRRSGRDRDWPGWGWTAKQWEEREAHQLALAEAAKVERENEQKQQGQTPGQGQGEADGDESGKSGKTGSQAGNGAGQKAGNIRVGGGPSHGGNTTASSSKGGDAGGSYDPGRDHFTGRTLYKWKDGKAIIETSGQFSTHGKVKVDVRPNEVAYDHTPWQNPANQRWYWIPPESVQGLRYRIEEIDAGRARALLEQATDSIHDTDR